MELLHGIILKSSVSSWVSNSSKESTISVNDFGNRRDFPTMLWNVSILQNLKCREPLLVRIFCTITEAVSSYQCSLESVISKLDYLSLSRTKRKSRVGQNLGQKLCLLDKLELESTVCLKTALCDRCLDELDTSLKQDLSLSLLN